MDNIEYAVDDTIQNKVSTQESLVVLEKKLLAAAKSAKEILVSREQALTNRLAQAEQLVDGSIKEIRTLVSRFKSVLENSGINTWRVQTEETYKAGQEQVGALQEIYADIHKSLKESCTRLQQASSQVVKGAGKALSNFQLHELDQLVDQCGDAVKNTSQLATNQMTNIARWFHWKNLVLVFFLSVLVTISIGLYTNAEWPWEGHKAAVKQRVAGQALLDNWGQLSQNDQRLVINDLSTQQHTTV